MQSSINPLSVYVDVQAQADTDFSLLEEQQESEFEPRELTVGSLFSQNHRSGIPYIRLKGLWLQELGFKTNDTILVESDEIGRVTLSVL